MKTVLPTFKQGGFLKLNNRGRALKLQTVTSICHKIDNE